MSFDPKENDIGHNTQYEHCLLADIMVGEGGKGSLSLFCSFVYDTMFCFSYQLGHILRSVYRSVFHY